MYKRQGELKRCIWIITNWYRTQAYYDSGTWRATWAGEGGGVLDVYKRQGYVWLTIGVNPVYVDTGIRIESAADLCCKCLDDVAMDVLYMTGNDHALEEADPLELAEIKRRWEPYINQLPDYAYLCKDLLDGKM